MKYLIYRLALLFLLASISSLGCSGTPGDSPVTGWPERDADLTWKGPQILLGVNRNQFFNSYPTANLEAMMWLALDYGVTFYGDDVYAPKWTGQGLSFEDPDRIVPGLLAHPLADQLYFWFPVSSHNQAKLAAAYNHWKSKGWFGEAKWFAFVSDEPRTTQQVKANNQAYMLFKSMYPEILWMVTREATVMKDTSQKVLGDIFIPMFHYWEVEKLWHDYYDTDLEDEYQNAVARGGYISGYMELPWSFTPGDYNQLCAQLGAEPPYVPTFVNGGTAQIPAYCRDENMEIFLFWNLQTLLESGPLGHPIPNEHGWLLLDGLY